VVLSLYERTGGKNARHNFVDSSTNVCALSYIAVQTYRLWTGGLFRATHPRFQMAFSFAQLTSSMFLCTLDAAPISVGGNIRLCGKDWEMYQSIAANMPDLRAALKKLVGRKFSA
ncbi:hypothetical protein F5876DRAFT_38986, partial [Lentinula aff. lateritia]